MSRYNTLCLFCNTNSRLSNECLCSNCQDRIPNYLSSLYNACRKMQRCLDEQQVDYCEFKSYVDKEIERVERLKISPDIEMLRIAATESVQVAKFINANIPLSTKQYLILYKKRMQGMHLIRIIKFKFPRELCTMEVPFF